MGEEGDKKKTKKKQNETTEGKGKQFSDVKGNAQVIF